jgi:nucleoid-associated protein YgaU
MANLVVTAKTNDGELWSGLSQRAYGDGMMWGKIIDANPTMPITDRLPSGVTLVIPVSDVTAGVVQDKTLLPPWKR